MARVQTRRSISVSRRLNSALDDYSARHDIAMSAFTEFVLERAIARPLDVAEFDAWFAKRAHVIASQQRVSAATSLAARDPGLIEIRKARRAAKEQRKAARNARRAIRDARCDARAEAGTDRACTACNGPGHHRTTCPLMHGPVPPPRRTFSMSDQAAMFRIKHGVSLADAASRFGVTRQAVHQRETKLRAAGVL
jgi:hypothetical protein